MAIVFPVLYLPSTPETFKTVAAEAFAEVNPKVDELAIPTYAFPAPSTNAVESIST